MTRKSFVLMVMGTVIFFFASISSADVPDSINYQGKLTTATGGCLNDTVSMTFTIYSDDQGTVVDWTETQNSVIVKEGIFNVLLGSVVAIPTLVFDGSTKYLGVQVESDLEMTPLKPMVSVAYAYRAGTADAAGGWVDDGTVVRLEDSTDQVGIGTSNPRAGYNLHLKDDGYAYLLFDHGLDTMWAVGSNSIDNQNLQINLVNPYGSATMASFGVNGDIRLAKAFGKVGIGTSPKGKLDVAEYLGADLAITNTDGTIETGDLLGQLMFYGHDGGDQVGAKIRSSAVEEWTPGSAAADLRFLTTPSGASVPAERMTITEDGNVGIGTTSPSHTLDVDGTARISGYVLGVPFGRIEVGDGNFAYADIEVTKSGSSSLALQDRDSGGGRFVVTHGATDGLTEFSTGADNPKFGFTGTELCVGIGTTSPQGALDVNSTTGAFIVPRMTTAQRNVLTPVNGMIIYNTTDNEFNFYENGAWVTK